MRGKGRGRGKTREEKRSDRGKRREVTEGREEK
jgi:hypothetical protein